MSQETDAFHRLCELLVRMRRAQENLLILKGQRLREVFALINVITDEHEHRQIRSLLAGWVPSRTAELLALQAEGIILDAQHP
jgi:hypothetical protein